MRWIRSAWWDGIWIFSGVPIGAVLATELVPWGVIFPTFLALNIGHLVAPIGMAWSHDGFRQVMLAQKRKYIYLPILIFAAGTLIGATVSTVFELNPITLAVRVRSESDLIRPFVLMLTIYFVWNAYHFGMQNYGLLRLYRSRLDRSAAMQYAMFGTIFCMIVLPDKLQHDPRIVLFFFGAVVFNHQLTAIGLASHVWAKHYSRNPLWPTATLVVIGVLLSWLILKIPPSRMLMTLIGARVATGFVHFLYDRWVWKLSDPRVRAIIGRDVFCSKAARSGL
jgi:hypothetical protein